MGKPTQYLRLVSVDDAGNETVSDNPMTAFLSTVSTVATRVMTGYESMGRQSIELNRQLMEEVRLSRDARMNDQARYLEMLQSYERLHSEASTRERLDRESLHRQELAETLTRDLGALIPVAVKKLLGIKLAAGDNKGPVVDFIKSFSPQQLDTLYETKTVKLDDVQLAILGEIVQMEAEEEKEREAKAKSEADAKAKAKAEEDARIAAAKKKRTRKPKPKAEEAHAEAEGGAT